MLGTPIEKPEGKARRRMAISIAALGMSIIGFTASLYIVGVFTAETERESIRIADSGFIIYDIGPAGTAYDVARAAGIASVIVGAVSLGVILWDLVRLGIKILRRRT